MVVLISSRVFTERVGACLALSLDTILYCRGYRGVVGLSGLEHMVVGGHARNDQEPEKGACMHVGS